VNTTSDDRSLGLRLGLAAVLSFVLLVPFALLAVLIIGDNPTLHGWDAAITDAFHDYALEHRLWVDFMIVWSWVFSPMSLRLLALVMIIWLVRRYRAWRLTWWVVATMTVGGVLAAVLKLLVGRDRPELLNPVARAAGYSFPSGHADNAALACAVFLLVLLPFVRGRRGWRITLWTSAIVIPIITGLCRIGLGVHWASDVVAGWFLGLATVAAMTVAFERWRIRAGRRPATVTTEGVSPEVAPRA
jgi:membrane-associated phospholipid phosphatase